MSAAERRLRAAAKAGDIGGIRAAIAERPWADEPRDREYILALAMTDAIRTRQWLAALYLNDLGAPLDCRVEQTEILLGARGLPGPSYWWPLPSEAIALVGGCPGPTLMEFVRRGMPTKLPEKVRRLQRAADRRARLALEDACREYVREHGLP